MRRRLLAAALLVVVAVTSGTPSPAVADSWQPAVVSVHPAAADSWQPAVVSEHPVAYTPHVLDGEVRAIAVVDRTVVVGGEFKKVADSSRRHLYARRNIFAFDLLTGAVLPFAPRVDGGVHALATGPGGTVYAGGTFTTVNGFGQRGLARLSLNGKRVSGFRAAINYGDVRTLAVRGDNVYAGGTFTGINRIRRAGLARLDAFTGAVDPGFDAQLTALGLPDTFVTSLDLSPDGQRLVAVGAMRRVGAIYRSQIAMFDVSGPRAALTDWYTDAFIPPCAPDFQAYLRQVKFSPDGTYIVVTTSGGTSGRDKVCDAAVRFQTAGPGRHEPVWVQHTGGNSLSAVAITGVAVYLGGHQLYMDNPDGHKVKNPGEKPFYTVGPGAVERPGIGAVDPATGKTLPWNPTRARGVGVYALVVVPQGLLVGSDTDELGHEYHGRIGMFPLPGAAPFRHSASTR
ncbi:PKD domain containing protein [Actinoplanes sp. KI2]|uniref:PKD domain containing protein n=1 Tax=Actinoplanes sp. KI2 TaxID=2983315 RepID=UPI0021D5D2CD|nr:PKD domain containing protein [Actinoplanes sp. KI2]MCU7729098.1 PKD domain containing protein [Actinoplanes sp. KI2]